VVLGPPALEEPTHVSRRRAAVARGLSAWVLALGIAGAPVPLGAVGEDPAGEVAEALRSFGAPGMVWGRLAIEEESPAGAWTPLGGVEVTLYPATPTLIAELDQIRRSARTSAAQYESVVARLQTALAAHQGRVDRQSGPRNVGTPPISGPPAPKASGSPRSQDATERPGGAGAPSKAPEERAEARHPWRQKTDPAGLFAFDGVPSGDWLVVAIRVSPYAAEKLRAEAKPRAAARGQRFLPRVATPAKEAELWVTRVRVVAAERVGLQLTDRTRWLTGPLR
jgi:hypothetical protein